MNDFDNEAGKPEFPFARPVGPVEASTGDIEYIPVIVEATSIVDTLSDDDVKLISDWLDQPDSEPTVESEFSDSVYEILDPVPSTYILASENMVVDLSQPPLNTEEAEQLTSQIRNTANVLYVLIKRAHAGKAWEALGYNSFESYVKTEFNYSRSYAYKLLNQANVIEAIESAAPEGSEVYVSDLTARAIKKNLPDLVEEIAEKTEGLDSEEAKPIIDDLVEEYKDKTDSVVDYDVDVQEKHSFFNKDNDAYEEMHVEDYDSEEPIETHEIIEYNIGDTIEDETRARFDNIYNLYAGLKSIASIENLDELLEHIPDDRREELTSMLNDVTPKLTSFKNNWDNVKSVEYSADNNVVNDDSLE